jgi:hypothetical protein
MSKQEETMESSEASTPKKKVIKVTPKCINVNKYDFLKQKYIELQQK